MRLGHRKVHFPASALPETKNHKLMTPQQLGYYFPAEFDKHTATWLSWPHKEASWPGKIQAIYPYYSQFVKELTLGEQVCINVKDEVMKAAAVGYLQQAGVNMD